MLYQKLEKISDISFKMRNGELMPSKLLSKQLDIVEEKNSKINAIITRNDNAVEQAYKKDCELKEGHSTGVFHGIPVTIKDNIAVAGMKATASYRPLANHIPEEDAVVVKRLKAAGAIILGKTNLPEMAMDAQTDSPLFGRTQNPWNTDYTSGGSSGGGAAAVASGMSFMDIGNDLLGSVRIPAGFCGVCSLTPTEHVIPHVGIVPERTMGGVLGRMFRMGILSNHVEDLRLALEVLEGETDFEPDIPPVRLCGKEHSVNGEKQVSSDTKLRIAYTMDFGIPISKEVVDSINGALHILKSKGHIIEEVKSDIFCFDELKKIFYRVLFGVLGQDIPPFARRLIRILKKIEPLDMDLTKYLRAEGRRIEISSVFERFFNSWDILVIPVTATTAFKHIKPDSFFGPMPVYKKGINIAGEHFDYAQATTGFTIPFSVTGNPVVTLPVGLSKQGLPISIQVVGKKWNDYRLLDACEKIAGVLSYT